MSKGLFFWLVFIVCVILGGVANVPRATPWPARPWVNGFIVFLLLGVLGWGLFGPPVH